MIVQLNSVLEDHMLKHQRLVFEFSVVSSATPASKSHKSDLQGVCLLATEGQLAEMADVEDVTGLDNYTAPSDANGILDVMLKGEELGGVRKVLKVAVQQKVAAGFSSPTVQVLGDNAGLTPGGNIAFEVDSSSDLSSDDVVFVAEIDYLLV